MRRPVASGRGSGRPGDDHGTDGERWHLRRCGARHRGRRASRRDGAPHRRRLRHIRVGVHRPRRRLRNHHATRRRTAPASAHAVLPGCGDHPGRTQHGSGSRDDADGRRRGGLRQPARGIPLRQPALRDRRGRPVQPPPVPARLSDLPPDGQSADAVSAHARGLGGNHPADARDARQLRRRVEGSAFRAVVRGIRRQTPTGSPGVSHRRVALPHPNHRIPHGARHRSPRRHRQPPRRADLHGGPGCRPHGRHRSRDRPDRICFPIGRRHGLPGVRLRRR